MSDEKPAIDYRKRYLADTEPLPPRHPSQYTLMHPAGLKRAP